MGYGGALTWLNSLLIPHTNLDDVISSLEDWGEDLNALKKSTTPYDGFLPVEGDEVFLGKSVSSAAVAPSSC